MKYLLFSKKVKEFIKDNPQKIIFLKNRLDKDSFLGLPFTILLILLIYVLVEYIGITDSILHGELITQIDIRLSEFFYYFKDIRLINLFLGISYFGSTMIVLLITFITSFILFINGKRIQIVGLFTSIGVVTIISTISKILIARPRPELAVYIEKGYSFPSFHATISVALYGFIIWLILVNTKKWKKRINLVFVGIFISFLIGFSRLYLNVHYLSDVIAGWFLGFLGLIFGITISSYLNHISKKKNYKKLFGKNNKIISYMIIIVGLVFSIYYYNIYYNNVIFTTKGKELYITVNSIKDIFRNTSEVRFTETITGRETEPINFIFITNNENKILELFQKSGWTQADKIGRTAMKKIGKNLLEHINYTTAPITPLYWNKRIQDFGFQKLPEENTIKLRHHIRIWKTDYKLGNNFIFVGCGVFDDGLKWGITHRIDSNIDKEREYIFNSLERSNLIKSEEKIQLEEGFQGTNFSGDPFFTDGKIYILALK